MNSLARLLLLATLLPVGSCREDSPSLERSEHVLPHGVTHLDPRLANGQSPAKELESWARVVREWSFQGSIEMPEAWALDAGVLQGEGPNGGLAIGVLEGRPGAPALRFLESVFPMEVNAVEVDVAIPNSAQAALAWYRPSPLEAGAALCLCAASPVPQTVRFPLSGMPTWSKSIEKLILKLSSNRLQGFELLAIRFVSEPLAWGQSPLDSAGETSGDAGLIVRGGVAYRSWPVRVGAPASCDVVVPQGGKLSVQVSRSTSSSPQNLNAILAINTKESGANEAAPLLHIHPLPTGQEEWRAVTVDLSTYEGQEVSISFSAVSSEPSDGELAPRADVLFGAPMILSTLPADRRPNILLVTLDTLRFDALGSSYEEAGRGPDPRRVQTPFLDALAEKSVVFTSAWSAGNSTQPSHASILTGASIQDHSLIDNFGVLGEGNTTLAERLREAGYQTAAVTCQRAIGPDSGFGQGFDMFIPAESVSGTDGRLAIDDARAWLEGWSKEGERPFFLWVHVFDPHTPYALPGDYLSSFEKVAGEMPPAQVTPPTLPVAKVVPAELAFLGDITSADHVDYLYHAEVAYTDALMADLFGTLQETGQAADTMSFVTADHGEFLGERGNFYNHRGLFPETLHVPLLMHLPGQVEGQRVTNRVTNRDIVPTVLGQLGLIEENPVRDLVKAAEVPGSSENRRFWFEHANGLQVGCRDKDYHFITTLREGLRFGMTKGSPGQPSIMALIPRGATLLFDWNLDPQLVNDLSSDRPEVVELYLQALAEYRSSAQPVGRLKREVSSKEAADLEALGYTGD
jgi:arylsulfatase